VDEGHKAGGDVLILPGTHEAADVADKKSKVCLGVQKLGLSVLWIQGTEMSNLKVQSGLFLMCLSLSRVESFDYFN
jgi:hypothetical protein